MSCFHVECSLLCPKDNSEFLAEHLVILQRGGREAQPLDYSTCGKRDGTSEHRNVS